MDSDRPGSGGDLMSHVLLPLANAKDARLTVEALAPYQPEHVTALHVIEKGEGVPDKTPVEQSEEIAAAIFEAVREHFPAADDRTAYDRDVLDAIFETAVEIGASSIVIRPRSGGRLTKLLSGDLVRRLIATADRPVIVLPDEA